MKKVFFLLLLPVCLRAQLPFAETLPSGTSGQTLRHDGTSFVASSVVTNNGTNVGIGASPDGTYKLYTSGAAKFAGRIYATGTGAYSVSTSPNLLLENTTSSTGRPFYLLSSDLGKLEFYSTPNSTPIMSLSNLGDVTVSKRALLTEKWGASGSGNEIIGRNSSGGLCKITLGSGLTLTDSTLSASGGGGSSYYQTFRDDGTGVTQRGKANFVSSSQISLALTDDSGNDETEVTATLAQNSATTGQVMKWNGSAWAPGTDNNDGGFNVISPSQLTARTDDWNPSGLSTAALIRVDGNSGFQQITGITAPASAKTLTLLNVGSYCVVLTKDDANSTAANRMNLEFDKTLAPGKTITLIYDATASRWKELSESPLQYPDKFFEKYLTLISTITSGDFSDVSFTTSGGGSSIANPGLGYPVTAQVYTSTSATGVSAIVPKNHYIRFENSGSENTAMCFRWRGNHPNLSDGTNTFVSRIGLMTSATTSGGDDGGVYFRYTHSENSGNWTCVTRTAGGTETTTNSGVAIGTSSNQTLAICVRPDGTAAFFIDDVLVATHAATNYPDNSNATWRVQIQKSAGTTSRYLNTTFLHWTAAYR